jgi:hypothetical protein
MCEYLTADELVTRWKGTVKKATLKNWRSSGKGPKFTKPGKEILYPITEVEKYEKTRGMK